MRMTSDGKTYRMSCSNSKYSDQPAHLRSLIGVFAVSMKYAMRPLLRLEYISEDSDHTARIHRLI